DFNDNYLWNVSLKDGSNQSTLSGDGTLTVSGCGNLAPTITVNMAKQHFDSLINGVDGAVGPTGPTGTVDVELPEAAAEPGVTRTVSGPSGDQQVIFPVGFYKNQDLQVEVQVRNTQGGECPAVGFTGASLVLV